MIDLKQGSDLQTLVYFLVEVAGRRVAPVGEAVDGSGTREWSFAWREPLEPGAPEVEITALAERDGAMTYWVREVAPPDGLAPLATTTGSPLALPWGCSPAQVRRAVDLAKERLLALVALETTAAG